MAHGNTHSARLVPGHQGKLLWVTDEYFSCPYGHLRMIDLSDEKYPKIISHFLTDQNTSCKGNQRPIRPDSRSAGPRPTLAMFGVMISSSWHGMAWDCG